MPLLSIAEWVPMSVPPLPALPPELLPPLAEPPEEPEEDGADDADGEDAGELRNTKKISAPPQIARASPASFTAQLRL